MRELPSAIIYLRLDGTYGRVRRADCDGWPETRMPIDLRLAEGSAPVAFDTFAIHRGEVEPSLYRAPDGTWIRRTAWHEDPRPTPRAPLYLEVGQQWAHHWLARNRHEIPPPIVKRKARRNQGKMERCLGIYMDAVVKGDTPPSAAEIAGQVECKGSTSAVYSTATLHPGQARISPTPHAATEPDELLAGIEMLDLGYWPVATYPRGTVRRDGRPSSGKDPIGGGWGLTRWSPDKLRSVFGRYPGAGVGTCLGPGCGPGGTWLIDLECDGPEAEDSLSLLLGGELVETPNWAATRGKHHLFLADGSVLLSLLEGAGARERKGAGQSGTWHLDALPGLEWRVGGYKPDGTRKQVQSVCPPTPGTDGRSREWIVPICTPVATLPEAAYAFLENVAERVAIQEEGRGESVTTGRMEGLRTTREIPAGLADGAAALERECSDVAAAVEGHRHDTLGGAALRIASLAKAGELDWSDGSRQLALAAGQCGLPDAEARNLIESAWLIAVPRGVRHNGFRSGADLSGLCLTPETGGGGLCLTREARGESLGRAKDRRPHVDVPPELRGTRTVESIARTMIALHEEAVRHGRDWFPGSSHHLGELSGVNHNTVLRRLEGMGALGYVSLLKPGIPGGKKASRVANIWRWHDPKRPGETVWNSWKRTRGEAR